MKYALVENGVCVNTIILLPYTAAREFPNAYPIDDVPVQIGDTLDRGVWMRNGQKVLSYAEQAINNTINIYDELAAAFTEGVNSIDE